jgi:uncharacterized sulfatase
MKIVFKPWLSFIMPLLIAAAQSPAAEPKPGVHPNVLFIVCDDLNTHLACYGDPIVKSPNVDRLAQRGVRFDRAYAQYPVCNPSRTSFLSGLHPDTTGVMDQQTILRDSMKDVVYLPEHFHANGYFTAALGKVQHGGHHDCSWDLTDDMKGSDADDDENSRPKKGKAKAAQTPKKRDTALPYLRERATEDNDPELTDTLIAKHVVKLLQEHQKSPFFIAVGFHKPHVPHVAPKKFFDLYPPEKMPLATVNDDEIKSIPTAALAAGKNYQPDMPAAQQQGIIRAYLACVSYMDEQLGVVMRTMDDLKLWDNTIVIFIGDHGWHFGEHHWWAKASLFEPSARVPLLVAAPGAAAGSVSPRVVELVDLYPTLSEICGLPKPAQGEGKSFATLLKDPKAPWSKPAFTTEHRPRVTGRSLRTERYRYTEWEEGKQGVELYDYDTDPGEHRNLAKDPKQEKLLAELKAQLHRQWK